MVFKMHVSQDTLNAPQGTPAYPGVPNRLSGYACLEVATPRVAWDSISAPQGTGTLRYSYSDAVGYPEVLM